MKTIKVDLQSKSYPIFIGRNIFHRFPEMVKLYAGPNDFVIICDERVKQLYLKPFVDHLQMASFNGKNLVIPIGEKYKSLATFEKIIGQMLEMNVSRDWGVIALGGGVVGDLAGYVAASYMRGIPFYQVPTTLLAQVDASIGGKVGINHPIAKNVIGAFYQPKLVWSDLEVLKTLPKEEIICGLAEVIKYGVIHERSFYVFCEKEIKNLLRLHPEELENAIYQSGQIKAEIVAEDEKEKGLRAILNFGHTIGHAIEAATGYGRLKHGEAVFWGMLAEAWISTSLGILNRAEFDRFEGFLMKIPLKASLEGINFDEIYDLMSHDKKVKDGKIRFALPLTLGEAKIYDSVPSETIRQALSYIRNHSWP